MTVRRSCRRARKAFDFDDERFTVLPSGVKKYHVRCPYCGAHGRDDGHHLVIDPNACGAYTKAGWPCDLVANHSGPCGSDAEVAQYMVRDGRRMPGEFE